MALRFCPTHIPLVLRSTRTSLFLLARYAPLRLRRTPDRAGYQPSIGTHKTPHKIRPVNLSLAALHTLLPTPLPLHSVLQYLAIVWVSIFRYTRATHATRCKFPMPTKKTCTSHAYALLLLLLLVYAVDARVLHMLTKVIMWSAYGMH